LFECELDDESVDHDAAEHERGDGAGALPPSRKKRNEHERTECRTDGYVGGKRAVERLPNLR
jgi:hypothetical protein